MIFLSLMKNELIDTLVRLEFLYLKCVPDKYNVLKCPVIVQIWQSHHGNDKLGNIILINQQTTITSHDGLKIVPVKGIHTAWHHMKTSQGYMLERVRL